MKLLRGAAAVGLAKKVYDEARKPENQRRIRHGLEKLKSEVAKRRH